MHSFTNDDADFAALVVEAAGHHGADGVVHHSHDVSFVVLKQPIRAQRRTNLSTSERELYFLPN